METTSTSPVELIIHEFKEALKELYGERLREVILYGSYARGDYDDESDIDLMVVLNDEEVNPYREIRRTSELEARFLLKYGLVISLLPTSAKRFKQSVMPIYGEVRREGKWV